MGFRDFGTGYLKPLILLLKSGELCFQLVSLKQILKAIANRKYSQLKN